MLNVEAEMGEGGCAFDRSNPAQMVIARLDRDQEPMLDVNEGGEW